MRPEWWDWEIDLTPHLLKRMEDRRFSEIDLRRMLEFATRWRRDRVPGRWVVDSRFRRRDWLIVVEPDREIEVLVVITAYPAENE